MTTSEPRAVFYNKEFFFALLAGAYFLWCAWDPAGWRLIDGANLLIHEAGHFVFMPFGEFVMIAGGSLLQVLMPAAFVFYFYRDDKPYSAGLVMLWMGESMLNVSVYAADSISMQLPLVGGPDSIHDWNYLLEHSGLLSATPKVAGLIRVAGTLVIATGIYVAIRNCAKPASTFDVR